MESLLRERMYDGVSLILSPSTAKSRGTHRFPSDELSFHGFAAGVHAHAAAFAELG